MANLSPKERFIHRDISWLDFNQRVLEEALDKKNPLLERLKFLAIYVNNLDEFLMVRLASVKGLLDSNTDKMGVYGYYPSQLLDELRSGIQESYKRLYHAYSANLVKEMRKSKIFMKKYEELNPNQQKFVRRHFEKTLFPIMTPMAVDQGRPFPVLPSKTLAFALAVIRKNEPRLIILPIPKNVSRLIPLPGDEDEFSFILVEDVLREHFTNFFRGWKIAGGTLFRIIRDSELAADEDYAPDLMTTIETEIKKRPRAKAIALEVEKSCNEEFLETLCGEVDFPKEEVTRINGDFDLSCFFELYKNVSKSDLKYPAYVPAKDETEDLFQKINEGDFIIHLPFQSFEPTVQLLEGAAKDPNVLAIKMTLYRTNEDSAIIKALKIAAHNKKQVTILVEIKARFDEEKNITWARELEDAGCHVVYGLPNMKIHSKITLIVRQEEKRIKRYVHLSTGNYNETTAKIYTDAGYFTANDDFARDISDVFNVITGYSLPARWKRIVSSPNDMRKYFCELIDDEIQYQKKYKNGLIFAKMNSLEDPEIIDKLYEASAAGVACKLIVRGMCCLIPGVTGLSEHIEVRSIVGRFLEHTRIYIFNNNSDPRIFLASADWMRRNFDRRIELLFEIYKDNIKEHLTSVMDAYWRDNVKSRILGSDRKFRFHKDQNPPFNVQEHLIQLYSS